ncbi:MAG: SDR family NAD(P)-dependent oxidoreductase [Propionibacteriaceae bacterium]
MNLRQPALITGATSGIGAAFAHEFARRDHDLILVARREAELHALASVLKQDYGVTSLVLPCDMSAPAARKQLITDIELQTSSITVLVNNAGYGDIGSFIDADPAKTTGMIELNCQALTELTHAFLPKMVASGQGTVINVASTAAFQAIPQMSTYAATKAYVLSFTQALAYETRNSSVRVTAICPGPTDTAFFEVAGAPTAMSHRRSPKQVVATALRAIEKGKPVAVDGLANRLGAFLGHHIPLRGAAPFIERAIAPRS